MNLIKILVLSFLTLSNSYNYLNMKSSDTWTPNSWKTKKMYQPIEYENIDELNKVTQELSKCAPLIFAGEADELKKNIVKASNGESFILMGGDCAETFREFSVQNVMNTYRVLLQMTLILMYGMSKPVVKIGRMAGQFAKPRSEIYETINGLTLPSYRGDIVNLEPFDEISRKPDPQLMIKGYSQSVQTMNLIRALSQGGYANIERIKDWNLNFAKNSDSNYNYDELSNNVKKSIKFFKALGLDKIEEARKADFYTAHESLLLPYETALTRKDSISGNYYDCSSHMLWIGERTRNLDGAHVEFARNIQNPIGIKISEKYNLADLENLIRLLNPDNVIGKIVLITRMGEKINSGLPPLVEMIKRRHLNVAWVSDPMHGNTIKLSNGIKTRYIESIKKEYKFFNDYLKSSNVFPAGIHLEMTGRNVTECMYENMSNDENNINDMINNYESSCDPRLSESQCLDLAFYIINLANN
jgi:3-deoxy-7-phosphoheptulonate synthase